MDSADNRTGLPSWLSILRGPSWSHLCEALPPWPRLYDEIWGSPEHFWDRDKVSLALAVMRRRWMRAISRMKSDVQAVEWPSVPSSDLVTLFESGLFVQFGIETLLPTPKAVSEAERLWCFYETLLRKGLKAYLDGELEKPPERLALRCGGAQLAGNAAWKEMLRRGEKHKPGFSAAVLLWTMAVAEAGLRGPRAEKAGEEAATILKRSVLSRAIPGRVRDAVDSQIIETVSERWGRADAFETLVRALDGCLNIAPQAITDDLRDLDTYERRRAPLEIDFEEREDTDESMEQRQQQLVQGKNPWTPLDDAMLRERLAALKADPKLTKLVKMAVENPGATQEALAKALGVTDRTIRNWRTQLKATLAD